MTIAVPSLTVEDVAIERLSPDPANPRRISEDELEALTRSLRQFGFVQPVLARRDGVVVGGHQRLVAARRLGLATVPVVWLDVSADQARLLASKGTPSSPQRGAGSDRSDRGHVTPRRGRQTAELDSGQHAHNTHGSDPKE